MNENFQQDIEAFNQFNLELQCKLDESLFESVREEQEKTGKRVKTVLGGESFLVIP